MAVTVRIPTALRAYADQQSRIDVDATTVGDAMLRLAEQYPDLQKHLFEDGAERKLRSFVNLYLGSEDVRNLDGPETPVKDGDTILVVPAVAGGAT